MNPVTEGYGVCAVCGTRRTVGELQQQTVTKSTRLAGHSTSVEWECRAPLACYEAYAAREKAKR